MRLLGLLAQVQLDSDKLPHTPLTTNSVQSAIQLASGIAGGVALIIVIIGGLRYVLSQGDPQNTAKAKNTIIYALIGLAVAVSSYAIVAYVVSRV